MLELTSLNQAGMQHNLGQNISFIYFIFTLARASSNSIYTSRKE